MSEITLTKAEQNITETQELIRSAKIHFLEIGRLLQDCYENAYYSQGGYEKFKDYIEMLGIGSYTFCTRLMSMASCVTQMLISREDVIEIGIGKMQDILPRLKKGKLSQDDIELAKAAPQRDLREFLGLKVPHNDSNHHVVCSRCGAEIIGAAWVKKEKDEPNPS